MVLKVNACTNLKNNCYKTYDFCKFINSNTIKYEVIKTCTIKYSVNLESLSKKSIKFKILYLDIFCCRYILLKSNKNILNILLFSLVLFNTNNFEDIFMKDNNQNKENNL